MSLFHIIMIAVVVLFAFFAYKMIKAMPKSMAFGAILMAVGVIWCAVALLSSTSVNNETVNFGLLFSQLVHIIIGCFITLIGSIFTAASFYTSKQP